MNNLLSIIIGSFAFLLRLYPRTYREEFAEEMLLDFTDMVMDVSKKGIWDFVLFLLHELIDFPANLLRAYLGEATMISNFRPGAAGNILRIALAFGLALAVNTFAGVVAFMDQSYLPNIWRVGHALGWRGTYQDIQSILLNISEFVLGPVLVALIFLAIFPEMRPIKRYLPAIALTFVLPAVLNNLRLTSLKNLDLAFEDTVFVLASYILVGLGFGILASLISRERGKRLWLLVTGPLSIFITSWVLNVLFLSFQIERSATFWSAVASVATRNILMGMIVGLLLGVVIEFKRQDNFPSQLSST
jgi:hypothetical protein